MSNTSEDAGEDIPARTVLGQAPHSFLETVSQEMDAALASLLGLAEQVPQSSSAPEQLAARIHRQGERLRPVLRSLKHLGHLHETQVEPEAVDAVDLASGLLENHRSAAHDQGLVLTLEAPAPPVEMTVDAETLRRALEHLLANAIAFTPEGAVTLHVDPGDTVVDFRVQDTGVGIPPDALPSLFEAFVQRPPQNGAPPEGLGLGLSLARAFARHLEGTLEAESEPGVGSVFTLRVPRRSGGDDARDSADGTTPPHLLVVDENKAAQRLFRRMLQENYRLDMAAGAGEAIRKAEENTYDAFVLDVNLEGRRTGVEVLHAVREMEDYTSVPVVACTAYVMDPHRKQFLRVGFDDIVTKPLAKRELIDVIEHELETPSSSEFKIPEGALTGIDLPPLPTTLTRITELASSDSSHDIEALTEALQRDQAVSQWLLRHINSAYYGLRATIGTVERAVSYLGFRPVCNLALTKVIGSSFSDVDRADASHVQRYIMKTSTLAAFIARDLADRFGIVTPETAYTGGMLAQIGRLALLSTKGRTYVDLWFERHDRTAPFLGPPPQGQEILNCEEDYLQKGLAVGNACHLSDNLCAVLRGHRRPTEVSAQFRPLVSVVGLALKVAHLMEDPNGNPWSGETTLTEELQGASVTRLLTEQGSLSLEELTAAIEEIADEADAFARDVLEMTT